MSDTQADTRYQPRGEIRYSAYPQIGNQQLQAQGPRQSAHASYGSEYPNQYASPSFPLPALQGLHHFASPAVESSQRFPHFQPQPQPLDWHSGSPASGVHLPPIRYQQADNRTQTQSQSPAQQPHRHPQPTDSNLRHGAWSFPQPPHRAHAEHEDARRPTYEPQAGYRSPPRDSWQAHSRTHSQPSQVQHSVPNLEHNSPGPSDDGTSRHWGGIDDDARSHEAASQVAKDDTDSEEDESGKKKRKRRRKANEAPRDLSQRKYSCQSCSKSFARPSALTTHERSHSKERPHLCPVVSCRRGFSVPSNLRRHQRLHGHPDPKGHGGSGSRPQSDGSDGGR